MAGVSGWQQVEDADSVKGSLEKRAEVEALNVADRQVDIVWLAEGTKITSKLSDFQGNINRIIGAGGNFKDKERWENYYGMFQCAIKATQDAYMPNAQRKQQYLAIYDDITKQNETLISFLVQLSNKRKTSSLLAARLERRNNVASHASSAISRWREAGKKNIGNNSGGSGTDDSQDNNIVRQ